MAGRKAVNRAFYNDALTGGHRLPSQSAMQAASTLVTPTWLLTITLTLLLNLIATPVASLPSAPALPLPSMTQLVSSSSGDAQLGEWNPSQPQTCQPVDKRSDLCADQPYNYTTMPNLLGHQDMGDALASLESFRLLIKSKCAPQIRFFLCALHLPMCTPIPHTDSVVVLPPCRPLCLHIRTKCEPVLHAFNYTWPDQFSCDGFPEENRSDEMCMPGDSVSESTAASTLLPTKAHVSTSTVTPQDAERPRWMCSEPDGVFVFVNATKRCALSCTTNIASSKPEKDGAEVLHGIVAGLTFLGALVVTFCFLCGQRRTTEQEKPFFFIFLCFVLLASGYVVRLVGRRRIGCSEPGLDGQAPSYLVGSATMEMPAAPCVVVFILLFYCGLAASIWWLVLSVAWYCAAVRGKKAERIQSMVRKFHFLAWLLPAALTCVGIGGKFIDTDELTAVCFIGQQNGSNLLMFVLVPQLAVVLTGGGVLLSGFIQLSRRRCCLTGKNVPALTKMEILSKSRDEKLFYLCVLFIPSTAVVIGCHFAEWLRHDARPVNSPDHVHVSLYFIRVVMQFIYVVVLAVWFCVTAKKQRPNLKPINQAIKYPATGLRQPPDVFVPTPLGSQPVKVRENCYLTGYYEDNVRPISETYNSTATGPYSPSPSLATAFTPQYSNGSSYGRQLVDRMVKQQELANKEFCKESYRSAVPDSDVVYV